MLENRRYNRTLEASSKQARSGGRGIFLSEEYRTQNALKQLGIKMNTPLFEIPHIDTLRMVPDLIPLLEHPYVIEVLGMPRAGKTTVMGRYLEELWSRDKRHKIHLVDGAGVTMKQEFGEQRHSDPFQYSMLRGEAIFLGYIGAMEQMDDGVCVVASDRGMVDRRVFRRALFSQGHVNPEIIINEKQFMYGLENTPIQLGGIVMLMVHPEESMRRSEGVGPIANMDFLPRLYEQYLRLHLQILQNEVPYCMYTCINGEGDREKVYERFKYFMDTALDVRSIFLVAISRAFPDEFDRAKAKYGKSP